MGARVGALDSDWVFQARKGQGTGREGRGWNLGQVPQPEPVSGAQANRHPLKVRILTDLEDTGECSFFPPTVKFSVGTRPSLGAFFHMERETGFEKAFLTQCIHKGFSGNKQKCSKVQVLCKHLRSQSFCLFPLLSLDTLHCRCSMGQGRFGGIASEARVVRACLTPTIPAFEVIYT